MLFVSYVASIFLIVQKFSISTTGPTAAPPTVVLGPKLKEEEP